MKDRMLAGIAVIVIAACASADASSTREWKRHESKLVGSYRQITACQAEESSREKAAEQARTTYQNTPEPRNWWAFSEAQAKKRARKAMDQADRDLSAAKGRREKAEEAFKGLLGSTPAGDRLRNLTPFEANTEAIELRNALIAIQAMAEAQGEMLKANPKDAQMAVEYYTMFRDMLGYAQTMFAAFSDRTANYYRKSLQNHWGEWLKHEKEMRLTAARTTDGPTREMLVRKADETAKAVAEMPENLRQLAKMHVWSEQNLVRLREKKEAACLLRDHAQLAVTTAELVSDVHSTRLALDFEDPPLVEFSLDIETLKIGPQPKAEVR